ncbi:MAG: cell division protein ZapA [Bacteroidales bacterium]|nr:cell division protein ZapA [Bacteroidales bacterium]
MAQSISIKIAGKDYPLVAASPERERQMRLAADDVNAMLLRYDEKFPDTQLVDKLAFVALNQAVGRIAAKEESAGCTGELRSLERELEAYLDGNGK